jgi:hypothetical protein
MQSWWKGGHPDLLQIVSHFYWKHQKLFINVISSSDRSGSILEFCLQLNLVDLDYNVMVYTRKTVFIYGQNGRVHITASMRRRQFTLLLAAGFCIGVSLNGLAPHSCRFVSLHSNQAPTGLSLVIVHVMDLAGNAIHWKCVQEEECSYYVLC